MDHLAIAAVASTTLALMLGLAIGKNAPGWAIAILCLACTFSISYLGTLIREISSLAQLVSV